MVPHFCLCLSSSCPTLPPLNIFICCYMAGYFRVNQTTGIIYTTKPFDTAAGVYNLTLAVKDKKGSLNQVDTATVSITVLEANKAPPIWITPSKDYANFTVLEVSV